MNSESELIKALRDMIVTEDPPIEYRLHYNDNGDVFMCSMQQHPDNTQYVVVSKEQYNLYFKYRVEKGQLKLIEHNFGVSKPFRQSLKGIRTVKNNPALILESSETYKDIEFYEHRNS